MLHRFHIELTLDDNAELYPGDPVPLSAHELDLLKQVVERQARSGFGMGRGTRRRPLYPVTVDSAIVTYK